MYKDILDGGGVKPKEILRLNWLLEHCNIRYGTGREIIGAEVKLSFSREGSVEACHGEKTHKEWEAKQK